MNFQVRVNAVYLCCEDALHGQDVHLRVNGKWSFDPRSDQIGSPNLHELVDLVSRCKNALECHVARGVSCTKERFLVVDGKYAVLYRCPNEAVCLSVPLHDNE